MTTSIKHPVLGEVLGVRDKGVIKFLGLKYASLKNRLALPELWEGHGSNSQVNASDLGPGVAALSPGLDMEFSFIQHALPKPKLLQSDVDGLNLNIAVPQELYATTNRGNRLPVAVYIHGGGFAIGSNSWPQYDFSRLISLSVEMGVPMIGVNINYRLGVYGFLTSKELDEAGYSGNRGLRDQRVALQWIQKFISGFGGDPENVTVIGQSAGGVSATIHLYSESPLFKRVAAVSGTVLLMPPRPPVIHEARYEAVLTALGLAKLPVSDRINALLTMSSEELVGKIGMSIPLHPVVDGDIISQAINFDAVARKDNSMRAPGMHWCQDLFIGNCQMDASIFSSMVESRRPGLAKKFSATLRKVLNENSSCATSLLASYHIDEGTTDDEALVAILEFVTDIGFLAPTVTYAKSFPGKAYVYCFNEPNTWDGPWKGHSNHILDVAYLFLNFQDYLTPAQSALGQRFAKDFIMFVNGRPPWDAFKPGNELVQVYGPSAEATPGDEAKCTKLADEASSRRRSVLFQYSENVGMDVLSNVWEAFIAGE